jgi:hypothetical protein
MGMLGRFELDLSTIFQTEGYVAVRLNVFNLA